MEKVKDLLSPNSGELKVRNDVKKGFFVEKLTANAVGDYQSINRVSNVLHSFLFAPLEGGGTCFFLALFLPCLFLFR